MGPVFHWLLRFFVRDSHRGFFPSSSAAPDVIAPTAEPGDIAYIAVVDNLLLSGVAPDAEMILKAPAIIYRVYRSNLPQDGTVSELVRWVGSSCCCLVLPLGCELWGRKGEKGGGVCGLSIFLM